MHPKKANRISNIGHVVSTNRSVYTVAPTKILPITKYTMINNMPSYGFIEGINEPYSKSEPQYMPHPKWPVYAKKIKDFDRVYTIEIQNTNPVPVHVTFFGAYQNLFGFAALPFPPGVLVNVPESSYFEMLWDSVHKPFIIGGANIQADVPAQLQQIPLIVDRDTNGVICSTPLHQFNYLSAFQFQGNSLEVYPISITLTGEKSIQTTLLPNVNMIITLYVFDRIDIVNKLHNEPVMEFNHDVEPNLVSGQEVTLYIPEEFLKKDGETIINPP